MNDIIKQLEKEKDMLAEQIDQLHQDRKRTFVSDSLFHDTLIGLHDRRKKVKDEIRVIKSLLKV